MKILRSDLLPAVQSLSQITGKRSLPILSTFRLEATGGKLSVRATDLDQDATFKVECKQDMAPLCVNARHFCQLVRDANDSIDLIPNGTKIELRSDWKSVLPTVPFEEFPQPMFQDGKAQSVSPTLLADGIDAVSWARSVDPDRFILNGTHVVVTAKAIICEGTDGGVMGHTTAPAISGKCEFILPALADRFSEALRKPGANLFLSENSALVRHGGGEYGVKLVAGNYPSTKLIFDSPRKTLGEFQIGPAISRVKTCIALSMDLWPKVVLEFSESGCVVSMVVDKGATEHAGSIPGRFAPMPFTTDAKRLLAGLESLACEKSNVHLSENRQLVFTRDGYTVFIASQRAK